MAWEELGSKWDIQKISVGLHVLMASYSLWLVFSFRVFLIPVVTGIILSGWRCDESGLIVTWVDCGQRTAYL